MVMPAAALGPKYKAALSASYAAGLSVSEVVALKVSDIGDIIVMTMFRTFFLLLARVTESPVGSLSSS